MTLAALRALLTIDLRRWMAHRAYAVCVGLAVVVLELAVADAGDRGSLFSAVLGGPAVAVVGGRLREGPGWTGFVIGVLFVIACLSMLDTKAEWIDLIVVRDVSQRRWAAARLAALAVGAIVFLAVLTGAIALAIATGWYSGPLVTAKTVWDVGLWVVGLISIGWFALGLDLVTGTTRWSLPVTLLVLSLARFGGGLAPYMPFSG